MKIYQILLIVLLLGSSVLKAQDSVMVKSLSQYPTESSRTHEFAQKYYYDEREKAKPYEINGESVVVTGELVLMKDPRINHQLDRNYYYFLNNKLSRVYPLFLTALEQYTDIQSDLKDLDKSNRRKY